MDQRYRPREFILFESGIPGDIKCQMERDEMRGRRDGKPLLDYTFYVMNRCNTGILSLEKRAFARVFHSLHVNFYNPSPTYENRILLLHSDKGDATNKLLRHVKRLLNENKRE